MLLSSVSGNAWNGFQPADSSRRSPLLRVLLGSKDLTRRSCVARCLYDIPTLVAITSSGPQMIARIAMACSERAWRYSTPTDFDMVFVDADLMEEASQFVALLRRTNYDGPLIVLSSDPAQEAHWLEAGFDYVLPFPTTNRQDFLGGLKRYFRRFHRRLGALGAEPILGNQRYSFQPG